MGFVPDDLDYTFNAVRTASEKEKAELATGIASSVAQLVTASVISPKQALKELKAAAQLTGRWTNITDEEIEQADDYSGPAGEDLGAIADLIGGAAAEPEVQ